MARTTRQVLSPKEGKTPRSDSRMMVVFSIPLHHLVLSKEEMLLTRISRLGAHVPKTNLILLNARTQNNRIKTRSNQSHPRVTSLSSRLCLVQTPQKSFQ